MFQNTDLVKAKEVIGDTMCIVGGMPLTYLKPGGSPEKVRDFTQELCETVGKDGGFIMTNTVLELEGCDPDLIDVWVDATKEFGIYT